MRRVRVIRERSREGDTKLSQGSVGRETEKGKKKKKKREGREERGRINKSC